MAPQDGKDPPAGNDPPPKRPSDINNPHKDDQHSSGSFLGWLIPIVIIGVIIGLIAWYIIARGRALREGRPPPSLNPFRDRSGASRQGGVAGWVRSKIDGFKNTRTAEGAYENTTRGGGRRGPGGMEPDEAWDARMGNQGDVYGSGGYYEEQELSIRDTDTSYAGAGYARPSTGRDSEDQRGRREENPFEEGAGPSNLSLRGVSPKPYAEDGATRGSLDTTERRSIFKEEV